MNAILHQGINVRPLQQRDLPAADRIMRLAFGTFLGLPDPSAFMGDADYVQTRWRTNPTAAFAVEQGDTLLGSNFASNWGSVGFFGPLTIHPDYWDRGVGKRLMEPVMDCFARWGTAHAGLFTFAQSEKHVGLYRKFGFWPRFLTAVVSKPVARVTTAAEWSLFSGLAVDARNETIRQCRAVTDANYAGLDVEMEIRAVAEQALGDTVLLWIDGALAGFAVCHAGPGTEAGSGACYIKFGAVKPGMAAAREFEQLLQAAEAFAAASDLLHLTAGVNTARHEAYGAMLALGFRTQVQGVAMQRDNDPGYNRPGVFLIDDWR
jgi:GNAT superfamily N-acetyltransferase